tara:strand:- start:817 stop:978 length:162 start_codon:yes stop_codon:yes gene_type:complete
MSNKKNKVFYEAVFDSCCQHDADGLTENAEDILPKRDKDTGSPITGQHKNTLK